MKKTIFSLLIIMSFSANAEFLDGTILHRLLNSSNNVERAAGAGYVMGVADSLMGVEICPPQNVDGKAVINTVREYVASNPQLHHHSADLFVQYVLKEIFPCNSIKKNDWRTHTQNNKSHVISVIRK